MPPVHKGKAATPDRELGPVCAGCGDGEAGRETARGDLPCRTRECAVKCAAQALPD